MLSPFGMHSQDTLLPLDRMQLKLASLKWITTNPEKALLTFETWAKNFHLKKQTDLEDLTVVYHAQALVAIEQPDEASAMLNKLLGKTDPFTEAMALKTLAGIDFKNGRFYASTVKTRAAIDLAKQLQEDELFAELQESLAQVFDKISKPDKAIQFYRRSLQLFTKLDKKPAIQKNALALGRIYLTIEKLDSALFFISQSLKLAKQEKMNAAIYESKIELGNYFYVKREFNKLSEQILELDSLSMGLKDDFLMVRLHVLKGNYAMAVQSESEALRAYGRAESYSHQGFTPFIDSYIKSNMADAYFRAGNLSKAYELVKYLNHNSTSYSTKENQKLAQGIAQNSELNLRDREIDYLKIQNQLNEERLKRVILIKENLRRENELKDHSLLQEQLLNTASIREKSLQAEQLEKEKALSLSLVRENDLRQRTIKDERHFQTILWTGIILLLLLTMLIYYLFKKQQEKNRIILKQTKDLEFVNKEVHHRVKNNLQVISSLLDLQSKYANDIRYENLLNESKHRVQSMAFIHQNLYESAGMNLVDMPNYIQNLVDHLWTAYQKEGEQVTIQVDVKPMHMHMDLVVSIGMIINELVTNSLKYAFANRPNGKIRIALYDVSNKFNLEVEDDGVGMPDSVDVAGSGSFGYKMIRAFVQKLKGTISINRNQGTQVLIEFNKR